ncbi:triosephosphate isomerase, chloroplastic [Hordeum vulgare]|nr:triosephosphate isomerase, chloroplastic [Hordeum vulgare]
MAAPSSLASSHLSRLAAAGAPAPQPHHQNHQLRLGCSRRRAQRLVAMAGSGKFFVGGNWKCVSAPPLSPQSRRLCEHGFHASAPRRWGNLEYGGGGDSPCAPRDVFGPRGGIVVVALGGFRLSLFVHADIVIYTVTEALF